MTPDPNCENCDGTGYYEVDPTGPEEDEVTLLCPCCVDNSLEDDPIDDII